MAAVFRALIILGLGCSAYALDYPSIWQCDQDKFHWYCDKEPVDKEENAPLPAATLNFQSAEQLRHELKRLEDIAIMQPTEQNMKNYLTVWQLVQEKSAVFADTWRRVVWQNPEFDYALKRPTNNSAIKLYDNARMDKEEQRLRMLAKEHGLIFFFKSNCQYCHAMAPALKMLSERYGIEILGVSVDGGGLPEFPNPRDGRNQAAKWGVERVPALFIGAKKTGEHAPVGFGMMAISEIVNRIFVLTGTKPGDNF